jgi:hypothetical protein
VRVNAPNEDQVGNGCFHRFSHPMISFSLSILSSWVLVDITLSSCTSTDDLLDVLLAPV